MLSSQFQMSRSPSQLCCRPTQSCNQMPKSRHTHKVVKVSKIDNNNKKWLSDSADINWNTTKQTPTRKLILNTNKFNKLTSHRHTRRIHSIHNAGHIGGASLEAHHRPCLGPHWGYFLSAGELRDGFNSSEHGGGVHEKPEELQGPDFNLHTRGA